VRENSFLNTAASPEVVYKDFPVYGPAGYLATAAVHAYGGKGSFHLECSYDTTTTTTTTMTTTKTATGRVFIRVNV